jgi:heavy metal sensor kinase
MLWNTAVVLVILLVNLVAIREGLSRTITQMVDEFIQEELTSAVEDFRRLDGQPELLHAQLNRRATSHPRRKLFIQLLDNRGALLWASDQSPVPDLLPPGALAFHSATLVGDYRVLCRQVSLPGHDPRTVRVGCSLAQAHLQMGRFTRIVLGTALLLLLAAPMGGYLLAGRATRPIGHIIDTTARLDLTHLDERLPIRGTRDELDRLSQTINHFLDRIAAYVRQSREFTANAAHELRSPLTALQSSLEIALNADRTVEEYKEVLSVLLEECGQMRVLANQLLLLAEGDAGQLRIHMQSLRLDQIVANSVEMFQAVAEAAGVKLAVRRVEPVMIQGDGNQLWQVVNNLLDNAIKFVPARGRVSFACRLDEGRHQCVLDVADTGPGIAPHDLPHIFNRFYQGNKARDREIPSLGLGLGLSICQAVVAAHGGTIEVASTPGQGATFTVRLPGCSRPDRAEKILAPSSDCRGGGRDAAESA